MANSNSKYTKSTQCGDYLCWHMESLDTFTHPSRTSEYTVHKHRCSHTHSFMHVFDI